MWEWGCGVGGVGGGKLECLCFPFVSTEHMDNVGHLFCVREQRV